MAKTPPPIDKMNEFEMLSEATDDLNAVTEVFGWLDALLTSIEDYADDSKREAQVSLMKIREISGLGRYLAMSWKDTANSMAGKFEKQLKVELDDLASLAVTGHAFATKSQPSSPIIKARESEHA